MKPDELEKMPLKVEKMFHDMQNRVLDDIVRRIRKTGRITSTADYQIEKLKIFGNSSEYIESEIKRVLNASDAEIWSLYDEVIDKQYTRDKSLYEQINGEFIPYDENEIMQSWVKAVVKQTKGELENLTRSVGFSIMMNGKRAFTPMSEYYRKHLDRACLDIVTGTFDYNTVLRRVVKEMTDSGIRTVAYSSGHSDRITVAARRAVMTGVRQLVNQINEDMAAKLGTDSYEVEWHSGARPAHWWGGMVFTMSELKSVCKLGDVAGLCGANCYHSYHAFVPGYSVRTYTDEQLAEMNAKELETNAWRGKEYNSYAATQQQRRMETVMRAQRSTVRELQHGDASKDLIEQAKAKYHGMLQQYQDFCKAVKLPPQMERVYMDGLGRVAPGRKTVYPKTERNGIINISEKQMGKKIGKHTKEYGLDPSKAADRKKMTDIINHILTSPDEIRTGQWRGQGEKHADSNNRQSGEVSFYIKGNDVVVVKGNNFVTILKDGALNSGRVKEAKKVK